MKIEQQVTSLELSKRLRELGVKQESIFYWVTFSSPSSSANGPVLVYHEHNLDEAPVDDVYSAFTPIELGEMLPDIIEGYESIQMGRYNGEHVVRYKKIGNELQEIRMSAKSEADCRAKMRVHLLENKLITV